MKNIFFRDRTRTLVTTLGLLCLLALGLGSYRFWAITPFNGKFENANMLTVVGNIEQVKSFAVGDSFKHLVQLKIVEVRDSENVTFVTGLPEPEDYIFFDVKDSKMNLLVNTLEGSAECNATGAVTICTYEVTHEGVATFTIVEELSESSGLPELKGVPR